MRIKQKTLLTPGVVERDTAGRHLRQLRIQQNATLQGHASMTADVRVNAERGEHADHERVSQANAVLEVANSRT
jgi:hypothetical protein